MQFQQPGKALASAGVKNFIFSTDWVSRTHSRQPLVCDPAFQTLPPSHSTMLMVIVVMVAIMVVIVTGAMVTVAIVTGVMVTVLFDRELGCGSSYAKSYPVNNEKLPRQ